MGGIVGGGGSEGVRGIGMGGGGAGGVGEGRLEFVCVRARARVYLCVCMRACIHACVQGSGSGVLRRCCECGWRTESERELDPRSLCHVYTHTYTHPYI